MASSSMNIRLARWPKRSARRWSSTASRHYFAASGRMPCRRTFPGIEPRRHTWMSIGGHWNRRETIQHPAGDQLNITNIVRNNENKRLTRSPAKAAAEWPINKAISSDDVGARKIAPGASVIAVQCVVAHHQVVIRADSADGRFVGKQRRDGRLSQLSCDKPIHVAGILIWPGRLFWIERINIFKMWRCLVEPPLIDD